MTNAEIRDYQARAKCYAAAHGEGNSADDFAQEAVIKVISGRKATIAQLFVDYLRQQYGSTRGSGNTLGRARSDGIRHTRSFDSPLEVGGERSLHDVLVAPEPVRSDWRARNSFGEREGLIADMRYDDELSEVDISYYFGVSESRICQILKKVNKKIESSAIIERCYENYKENENYSKLSINWITI